MHFLSENQTKRTHFVDYSLFVILKMKNIKKSVEECSLIKEYPSKTVSLTRHGGYSMIYFASLIYQSHKLAYPVVDLGWGAEGRTLSPQECYPLQTQRVPPLYYFEISIFG